MQPRRRPYQPINATPRTRGQQIGDRLALAAVLLATLILIFSCGFQMVAAHF